MGNALVIVESPAKAKTINKFLGRNYTVKASMGHVRDLPKRTLGVDEEDFSPTYDVLAEKRGHEATGVLLTGGRGFPEPGRGRPPAGLDDPWRTR